MAKDYYKILEVSNTATTEEITTSYRRLARIYHPDINKDEDAVAKFKEITEAFEVLNDSRKKADYDNPIKSRSKTIRRVKRGSDMRYHLTISFYESVKGCCKELELRKKKPCDQCNRTGYTTLEECTVCGGVGQLVMQQGGWALAHPCPTCSGSGIRHAVRCKNCDDGYIDDGVETISVTIPIGVFDKSSLHVPGKGEYGPDGRGDLYVLISIKHDKVFSRVDYDLFVKVPVKYSDIVLGNEIDVPVIDGEVKMTLKPGTPITSKLRLRGQGVTCNKKKGDLIVSLDLVIPKNFTPEYEQKLKELDGLENVN